MKPLVSQMSKYTRAWRKANPIKYREHRKKWRLAHPEKYKAQKQRWRMKNKLNLNEQVKAQARRRANYTLEIIDKCEVCKKNKATERHHEDYFKPLMVLFVCNECHRKIHTYVSEGITREVGIYD